jgi:thioredoxin 1
MALEINESNFEELVIGTDKPVVLDFWAVWCGPCRMIAPIIEEMHHEYGDKAVIGKVDVDNNNEIHRNTESAIFQPFCSQKRRSG